MPSPLPAADFAPRCSRRLHCYLTQPFPRLETFTGKLGGYIPAAETVGICRAILDGVYDEVEEGAFLFVKNFGK